jgi:hypothetical protein
MPQRHTHAYWWCACRTASSCGCGGGAAAAGGRANPAAAAAAEAAWGWRGLRQAAQYRAVRGLSSVQIAHAHSPTAGPATDDALGGGAVAIRDTAGGVRDAAGADKAGGRCVRLVQATAVPAGARAAAAPAPTVGTSEGASRPTRGAAASAKL